MNIKLEKILKEGLSFKHLYDFGSTTTLKLKVISKYTDFRHNKKVELPARNIAPIRTCDKCGEIAENICVDCGKWLCRKCSENHECGEELLLPVVNSPRVGVCAYEG